MSMTCRGCSEPLSSSLFFLFLLFFFVFFFSLFLDILGLLSSLMLITSPTGTPCTDGSLSSSLSNSALLTSVEASLGTSPSDESSPLLLEDSCNPLSAMSNSSAGPLLLSLSSASLDMPTSVVWSEISTLLGALSFGACSPKKPLISNSLIDFVMLSSGFSVTFPSLELLFLGSKSMPSLDVLYFGLSLETSSALESVFLAERDESTPSSMEELSSDIRDLTLWYEPSQLSFSSLSSIFG
mmetsp:Transcript_4964/g.12465  ORF Transcript_4964/g.12465 Transcript_4964/m.12465 type:complete len:240 (-) Transcript_4964:1455-2174(-)